MSTVNGNCVDKIGRINGHEIEAKFRWTFPTHLPLPVNQKWTVSVKRAFLTDRIVNVKNDTDFIFAVMWSEREGQHMNLADKLGCAKSVPQLVRVLNSMIPDPVKKMNLVYFESKGKTEMTLMVGDHCQVVLGKKLALALGIRDVGTNVGPTSLYQEGGYSNDGISDVGGVLRLGTVHVVMDVVRPSIFGDKQKNVICTFDPTCPNSFADSNYHDLMESPITSVIISFIDDKGELIRLTPYSDNDFLFSLVIQFKRTMLM